MPLAAAPFMPVIRPSEPPVPLLGPLPAPLPAVDELPSSNTLGCELELRAAQVHAATKTGVIPTATRTLRGMLQIEHQYVLMKPTDDDTNPLSEKFYRVAKMSRSVSCTGRRAACARAQGSEI